MSILNHKPITEEGKRANDSEQSSPNSLDENATAPLLRTLKSLQKQSEKVEKNNERANCSLYNHLASAYLWWRKAKEVEGFIEAEYEKLPVRKSTGKATPNFIPVLRVICGKETHIKDQEFQRRSRALNAIHIEFEKHPKKYQRDGITKLVSFITSKGGVSELAGYRYSDKGPADTHTAGIETTQDVIAEKANSVAVIEVAVEALVSQENTTALNTDSLPEYVSTDDRDCFLLLVQQTSDGSRVIGRNCDHELVEFVLGENHRKRFEAHASITRPLLELVQTQCYPKHLSSVANKLVDATKLEGFKQKKFTSHRRVMFLQESQQFLLSPINAYSGVVSLVTPNQQVFGKCEQDLYMPHEQRAELEQQLLQGFDFNLYDADEFKQLPADDSDSASSHAVTLVHRADSKKTIDLHFSPFYESLEQPVDQVGVNPAYRFKPQWQATLPHCYFQKLSDQFLDPWFEGKGRHISRAYSSLVQVNFGSEGLDIDFTYKNGKFEGQKAVEYIKKRKSKRSFGSTFLSKDWLLAFRSIALLPVDGDVSLAINDDVLRVDFATIGGGGAQHEIHIPTVDLKGNRSTEPFVRYEPALISDEAIEGEVLQ